MVQGVNDVLTWGERSHFTPIYACSQVQATDDLWQQCRITATLIVGVTTIPTTPSEHHISSNEPQFAFLPPETRSHETSLATSVRQKPRGYVGTVSAYPNNKTKEFTEASLGSITFHNS